MSDINEEIVDRVLQGLRDAASPDGMESRIVSAVRHRAAATPIIARSPRKTTLLVGSAVLATVACVLFFNARWKTPQSSATRFQAIPMQTGNVPVTPFTAATRKPPKLAFRRARLATTSSQREEESTRVSYPAPPMPLTEQEKLLLRLVHEGDPVQIAMLNPVQRDARYAAEHADFTQFFEPLAEKTQ